MKDRRGSGSICLGAQVEQVGEETVFRNLRGIGIAYENATSRVLLRTASLASRRQGQAEVNY